MNKIFENWKNLNEDKEKAINFLIENGFKDTESIDTRSVDWLMDFLSYENGKNVYIYTPLAYEVYFNNKEELFEIYEILETLIESENLAGMMSQENYNTINILMNQFEGSEEDNIIDFMENEYEGDLNKVVESIIDFEHENDYLKLELNYKDGENTGTFFILK